MRKFFTRIAITMLLIAPFTASFSSCNYAIGNIAVVGNCIYDSISNTYFAHEGETLQLFYTGTGSGGDYIELHYYNDSLIGSRLDTVQVSSSGTYKVEIGCFGKEHTFSSTIVFTPFNTAPLLSDNVGFIPRICQHSNNIELLIESQTQERFNIEIISATGGVLHESVLFANTKSSFSQLNKGLNIVRISNEKGQSLVRKIIIL